MKLSSSPKAYYQGTHRAKAPEDTLRHVRSRIKASGLPVLRQILRIDNLDVIGIPVFAVTHTDKSGNTMLPSWGKGIDEALACASGLMERVERYSACDVEVHSNEIVYDSFESLGRKSAISRWEFVPCNLQRKTLTKRALDRRVMPWLRCFSLMDSKDVYVPGNLVFFRKDFNPGDFSDTTGLASGNSLEEAILHGLCEVIERHVEDVAHWNKKKTPVINIRSINDPDILLIIKKFKSCGIRLNISYLSGSFKVPVIRVTGYGISGPYPDAYSFYGAVGAHPDKKVALLRALTEFAQSRASLFYRLDHGLANQKMSNRLPDFITEFYDDVIDPEKLLDFNDVVSYDNDDFLKDIVLIKDILSKKGCEIFIKDLTHNAFGIPVVRVIVKGLQPGLFGIGIVDLNHKVARVSKHLKYHSYLVKNIKHIALGG